MTPARATSWYDDLAAPQAAYKSALETVSNSTTLQDDNHISALVVAAAKQYALRGVMNAALKSASDLKICFTFSSAPTSFVVTFSVVFLTTGTIVRGTQTSSGTGVAITVPADESALIYIDGFIDNSLGSAATLKLQWAQNAAVVEDTTLGRDSWVELIRLN
jgi:hypothetical protein